MITAIMCTKRTEPMFNWLADSFTHAINKTNIAIELIVVDGCLWNEPTARRQKLAEAVNGRFAYRHVEPKPCAWQGPTRLTRRDYFSLCNARNTGLALARGNHVVFFDDCTVLPEDFFVWHGTAAKRGIAVAGSYYTYNTAVVENGKVLSGEPHPLAEDNRGKEIQPAPGGWLWGLNMSFPLDYALAVNGYDEFFDSQAGSEDCFGFSTEIVTDEGIQKIGDLIGQSVNVLTLNKKWIRADIQKFSKRQLWHIVCQNGYGHTKDVYCTDTHKWFVKDYTDWENRNVHIVTTEQLKPGKHEFCYLTATSALKTKTVPSPFGIAHGIAFGDGCNEKGKTSGKVALYGAKQELKKFFSNCNEYPTKCGGVVLSGLPNFFKSAPSIHENTSYLLGWIMGYFAADGCVGKTGSASLSSTSYNDIKFFRDVCIVMGIECYPIRTYVRDTNFKDNSTLYQVTLGKHSLTAEFFLRAQHRDRFHKNENTQYTTTRLNEWEIISVNPTNRVEDTYCAVVPDTHAFVLEGGILTHNCDTGVRLQRAGCKIWHVPQCKIIQVLETHEAIANQVGWGGETKAKQKEIMLKDGKNHFANEKLIQDLFENPQQIWSRGNDFVLRDLRKEALLTGNFPVERLVGEFSPDGKLISEPNVDWRDGQRLADM